MFITKEQLAAAVGCDVAKAEKWVLAVISATEKWAINTPMRMACFLAQVGHESGNFKEIEENLSYSAERLKQIFGKYFVNRPAEDFAHKPEAIGNLVYGNRMGNGDEASGDGYRYRGRGLIQVTGKDNYKACGVALDLDLLGHPEKLAEPFYAADSAGWFWGTHGCNELADTGSLEPMTKRINGGLNGYPDRVERFNRAWKVLGKQA